jgi:DNA-binding beta-propeller fold protein YncE
VKRKKVVHTFYNTVSMLRTIEEILGAEPLGFTDANAATMDDVFTTKPDFTPFEYTIPGALCAAPVDPSLVPECRQPDARKSPVVADRHNGSWWAAQTRNLNLADVDAVDQEKYNRILWVGIVGEGIAYPSRRNQEDFAKHRWGLLKVRRPPAFVH